MTQSSIEKQMLVAYKQDNTTLKASKQAKKKWELYKYLKHMDWQIILLWKYMIQTDGCQCIKYIYISIY